MTNSSSKTLDLLQPEVVHADQRRTLTQLVTADLKQVNVYQVNKGCVLGGHYHMHTNEYFYVTKGSFVVFMHRFGEKHSASRILNKGSFFMAGSGYVHSLEALTNGEFLTFLTLPFNPKEPDLWQDEL